MEESIAAVVGALVGVVGTVITTTWSKRSESEASIEIRRRELVDALAGELRANRRLAEKCTTKIAETLQSYSAEDLERNDLIVDDEGRVYISEPVDIALATWINSDVTRVLKQFPLEALISYKLALARVRYLVERNKAFRYRFHYLQELRRSLMVLADEITSLERAVGDWNR